MLDGETLRASAVALAAGPDFTAEVVHCALRERRLGRLPVESAVSVDVDAVEAWLATVWQLVGTYEQGRYEQGVDLVYGYSFIATNVDVSTPDKADVKPRRHPMSPTLRRPQYQHGVDGALLAINMS